MSKRIGEVLIEKGLLNPTQLERALKAQLILGGHLGTCLIEMGFVDEADLGKVLSEIFEVPYADPRVIREVPRHVLARVSAKLAERHSVVPFDVDDRILRLAMVHPRDLHALDEVRFAAGVPVEPWVSPEVRIVEALERHYGVERRARYITICRELDRRVLVGAAAPAHGREGGAAVARDAGARTEPPREGRSVDPDQPTIGEAAADPAAYGYGRSWTEIAPEGIFHDLPPSGDPTPSTSDAIKELREETLDTLVSLEDVGFLLSGADELDHIASAALMYVTTTAPRSVLFTVKGGAATIWNVRGITASTGLLRAVRFPVTSGWIFKLLGGQEYHRGPIPSDPTLGSLHATLGLPAPAEAIVVPIHLNDRLVAILYADSGTGAAIGERTESFLRLGRMIALTLNLIILKRKIRTT